MWPVLVLTAGVHQFHVEIRREDESEKSHRGGPHQVQNGSKAGHGLCYEEQTEDRETPEHTSSPVKVGRNVQELFEGLGSEWSTLIGPDPSRYCALIGGNLLCWMLVNAITTHLKASNMHFMPFTELLWHDKWLPCTERIYYRRPLDSFLGNSCLELCFYGI